jgi:hypothetical protein
MTTAIQGTAMLVSIPLYWLAVGRWGMTGAAVVSSAIYASVCGAGVVMFLRHRSDAGARLVPGIHDVRDALALARESIRPAAPASGDG